MGKKIILLLLLSFFVLIKEAEAKVLPQARKGIQKASSSFGSSVRLRADRKALILNFSNLQNASAVSYALTYNTSEQQEGAMGAVNLAGASTTSQELLFGTCSKNVCRYHTGIKDTKLDISYTLKSGKKYLKKYRIKV